MKFALPHALALAAGLAFGTPASAAGTASFLVVHGIPGRDVGAGFDPALPVDVLVNGSLCLLKNFTFGDIAGPYDVPAGTYDVAVSLANPLAPCSNTAVIDASVTLKNGDFGALVAQLSTQGVPTAGVYPVDVSSVGAGMQRFVTVHAADAPAVTVRAKSLGPKSEKLSFKISPGATKTAMVPTRPGFELEILAGGATVAGPIDVVNAGDQSVIFAAAVGNAGTGSVTILTRLLRSAF